MTDDDSDDNEYLNLPDDPEIAFAILHRRKHHELEQIWENDGNRGGWYAERRYVDTLIAFDDVHDLNILAAYRTPPVGNNEFADFFQDFLRNAEISSQKIMMEAARRQKIGVEQIIVLDANARQTIHVLVNSLREKLNELTLPESKREALFAKLNAFASEVDRNRTRTEAFYAFAIEAARTTKEVHEELKPLEQTIDRIFDWIEKAKKWRDSLPPWNERKKIEGPRKQLPSPKGDIDDEIPF